MSGGSDIESTHVSEAGNLYFRDPQLTETCNDAILIVRAIWNVTNSRLYPIEFEKFKSIAKLRSEHYKNYLVLCLLNSLRSAG